MDAITRAIIKLVNIRYPFVKVICSDTGILSIENYYPKLSLGESLQVKWRADDESEEDEYLSSAKEYMLALRYLALSQPGDLARLAGLVEDEVRAKFREISAQGQADEDHDALFNRPYEIVDVKDCREWAKRGSWTLHQAVTLLLGRNPHTVHDFMIQDAAKAMSHDEVAPSVFIEEYYELLTLVRSHVGGTHGKLSDPVYPPIFLKWADRLEIAVPPELRETVGRYHFDDWQSLVETKTEPFGDMHGQSSPESDRHPSTSAGAESETSAAPARSMLPALSRKAIRKLFHEISDAQWRGLFNREAANGLLHCRVSTAEQSLHYDPMKLALWIGNNRSEMKVTDAIDRIRDTIDDAKGDQFNGPTAHDPFGLSKKRSR
jgi:hypothetical protein